MYVYSPDKKHHDLKYQLISRVLTLSLVLVQLVDQFYFYLNIDILIEVGSAWAIGHLYKFLSGSGRYGK